MSEIDARYTRIDKTIDSVVGKVVLETAASYPRDESNLYCVSTSGKIVWFAERPDDGSHYSRVRFDDQGEKLLTYSTHGHACELDLKTGKLLSQVSML
jgi:hypothetical protein